MNKELLENIQTREFISNEDSIFTEINEIVENTLKLTSELNTGHKTPEEVRNILRKFILSEDIFQNLTVELKNVDSKVVAVGKILDFLKEDDIPSYDKNSFPPPRDTEEGRAEKRKVFESINFNDMEKYKHFAKGNFTFHKNVATVEKYDDIDISNAEFSDIVML